MSKFTQFGRQVLKTSNIVNAVPIDRLNRFTMFGLRSKNLYSIKLTYVEEFHDLPFYLFGTVPFRDSLKYYEFHQKEFHYICKGTRDEVLDRVEKIINGGNLSKS